MTYYKDLTAYSYSHFPRHDTWLVNIGWLDSNHPFPNGEVDPVIVEKIRELCKAPAHQTRGLPKCSMCSEFPIREVISGETVTLGSAEIHVPGEGVTYPCPTLIYHYIVKHGYLPPEEFLCAVRQLLR
jgi:hypothetical protein